MGVFLEEIYNKIARDHGHYAKTNNLLNVNFLTSEINKIQPRQPLFPQVTFSKNDPFHLLILVLFKHFLSNKTEPGLNP